MSTETAANDHGIPLESGGAYNAQPDPYEIERKEALIFNTGPCANKTLPTDFQLVRVDGRPAAATMASQQDFSSPENAQFPAISAPTPQPHGEDKSSSNISGGAGGGSCSDKELEVIHQQCQLQQQVQVQGEGLQHQPSHVPPYQTLNSINPIPVPEEKKPRKRRRQTESRSEHTPQRIDKFGKKITEYIGNIAHKMSPNRGGVYPSYAFPQPATNGDSLSNDLTPLCVSPIPSGTVPTVSNRTPMMQGQYASSDSSNQSPPTASTSSSARVDNEAQTEASSTEMDCSAKFLHQIQQDKLKEELLKANAELKQSLEVQKARVRASKDTIKRLLIKQSRMERKQAKEKCMENTLRIGQFKPIRRGEHFKDEWTDGYAMEDINRRLSKINHERNEIQNATQNLRKRKTTTRETKKQIGDAQPASASAVASSSTTSSYTEDGFLRPEPPKEMTPQEYMEQEEIYRLRKEHLKREESESLQEKDRLERERNTHIREMKRVQYEEASRFRDVESLNNRYLLLQLLGKGGFSEVWRAFDLDENRYVACKIHHVNKEWKEDKKANYVKHAMREKDIHKLLDHPRIVRLFDLFTIDCDTFCTVLEYCDGNDLDFYLKQHKHIPEKEARLIIMQIVSALKYLSERKHPIIHYDLKPANILLSSGTPGEIKITDFGLSKELESEDDDGSIELTSQGAGTYWYLPPETFRTSLHGEPPTINLKVDVWSVGVVFFQCLYGKRPFGHELSQQRILQENTILNATEVTFPSKPPVSAAAHDFIRRCLQCKKEERADIGELSRHELFKPRGQKSLQPPSPSSIKSGRVDSADDI